jgi:RNA polymerase sigma factor for flagellar operon FliA
VDNYRVVKDRSHGIAKLGKVQIKGLSRNQIIETFAPLARLVASKIAARLPSSVELDDLISAGVMGLIDAIDKFDDTKSSSFKKYAEIRIRGAILDELRSMDWVSRAVRRQSAKLTGTQRELRRRFGRDATPDEVADELGIDLEQYFKLLDKLKPILLLSFEDLGLNSDGEQRSFSEYLRDWRAIDPSIAVHVNKLREIVKETIDALPDRQRIVITMYYFEGMNLKEVGRVLEVTESRVSQLHAQAVQSLKAKIRRRFSKASS